MESNEAAPVAYWSVSRIEPGAARTWVSFVRGDATEADGKRYLVVAARYELRALDAGYLPLPSVEPRFVEVTPDEAAHASVEVWAMLLRLAINLIRPSPPPPSSSRRPFEWNPRRRARPSAAPRAAPAQRPPAPCAPPATAAEQHAARLFGVDVDADPQTIRRAFLRAVRAVHPDHAGATVENHERTRLLLTARACLFARANARSARRCA